MIPKTTLARIVARQRKNLDDRIAGMPRAILASMPYLTDQALLIGGVRAKPSREIRPGDRLEIHRGQEVFTVYVEALSNQRGPAAQAQTLYRETQESVEARARAREMQKLAAEPALAVDRGRGRPTKKEGRELRRFKSSFWES